MKKSATGVLLLSGALMACASSGSQEPVAGFGQSGPSTVTVEVNNRNFDRATLHWSTPGTRVRLGVVEGVSVRTFTIERFTVSQPVQIEINQTGGARCITPELITDPGDHLYLEIAPVFGETANCVR